MPFLISFQAPEVAGFEVGSRFNQTPNRTQRSRSTFEQNMPEREPNRTLPALVRTEARTVYDDQINYTRVNPGNRAQDAIGKMVAGHPQVQWKANTADLEDRLRIHDPRRVLDYCPRF
ncbi:hypothetical protein C8R46DRAFT_1037729 [Mycena filopes]|nr:hypothetical protein C8R46DRAFT_1037729 [Mycena filopes]